VIDTTSSADPTYCVKEIMRHYDQNGFNYRLCSWTLGPPSPKIKFGNQRTAYISNGMQTIRPPPIIRLDSFYLLWHNIP